MPHSLTLHQKEYLDFIKDYIQKHQDSPALKDIADHFQVKLPTAHKTLDALQNKDFIFFMRHPERGFIIRLVERGGQGEKVFPLYIVGKVDQYGKVTDWLDNINLLLTRPNKLESLESIPIIQKGNDPFSFFGLKAEDDIPALSIEKGDVFVVDFEKTPVEEDLTLLPVGPDGQLYLCRSLGLTVDDRFFSWDMKAPYPLPEKFVKKDLGQRMFYIPAALNEYTEEFFSDPANDYAFPEVPIPMSLVFGTVVQSIREF